MLQVFSAQSMFCLLRVATLSLALLSHMLSYCLHHKVHLSYTLLCVHPHTRISLSHSASLLSCVLPGYLSGAEFVFFCVDKAAVAKLTAGKYTGKYKQCTNTFAACKRQLPHAANEDYIEWQNVNGFMCHKGLPFEMCNACHEAGTETYIIMVITCLIQIPLVWLSIRRTSTHGDSRCLKFSSLPLALVVIIGASVAWTRWKVRMPQPQYYQSRLPLFKSR